MMRLSRLVNFTAQVKVTADYYKVLEISKTASQEEIKFAFYRLSQLYHPNITTSAESKESFNLLNEAYVILSDVKSRRAYDLVHKIDPRTVVTPTEREGVQRPQTAYEKSREEKQEFKRKYNIDEFGRFRGGVPNKRKGTIRGTSLEEPGKFFSHIVHQDTVDTDPDYQYVTPQVAQSFKKFHQDQRQFRSFKWPWFHVQIDYQTFSGKRLMKWLGNVLIFLALAYAVPTYYKVGNRLYLNYLEQAEINKTIERLNKEKAASEAISVSNNVKSESE